MLATAIPAPSDSPSLLHISHSSLLHQFMAKSRGALYQPFISPAPVYGEVSRCTVSAIHLSCTSLWRDLVVNCCYIHLFCSGLRRCLAVCCRYVHFYCSGLRRCLAARCSYIYLFCSGIRRCLAVCCRYLRLFCSGLRRCLAVSSRYIYSQRK